MASPDSNLQQTLTSETLTSPTSELSRTKSIATRLTEAELAEVEAAASQAGKKVAEWLRDATYLENTGATLDDVAFWGSPYTPEFMNWAFMYQRGSGARHWELIPDNLDVLITHGPPLGILDQTAPGEAHLGCAELLDTVIRKRPRVHIFGHIHGGAGTFENDETRFINAAYLNERYKPLPPAGKIHIVDISPQNLEYAS